jgi:cell division protein FtsB
MGTTKKEFESGFSREFFVVLCLIILTFFFFIQQINQMGVNQIWLDVRELERENGVLSERIARIKQDIALLETDLGIEMEARRKLRLIKPGEIIIKEYETLEVQLQSPLQEEK